MTSPGVTTLALLYESVNRLGRNKKNKHNNKNELDKRTETTNLSKIDAICTQDTVCGSLILCLILVYLGSVKGISHTKSIKRVCLLNQQSDVEFVQPVDK